MVKTSHAKDSNSLRIALAFLNWIAMVFFGKDSTLGIDQERATSYRLG
jgi:hypothetical protein